MKLDNKDNKILQKWLLEIIASTCCKKNMDFDHKSAKLICSACRMKYDVLNGIAILITDKDETGRGK